MIGTTRRGILTTEPTAENSESSAPELSISSYEFTSNDQATLKNLNQHSYIKKTVSFAAQKDSQTVSHASIQILNRYAKWDTDKGSKKEKAARNLYYILGIVKRHAHQQKSSYSSSIHLLQEDNSACNSKEIQLQSLDDFQLVDNIEDELKVHILSTRINPSEESDRDTLEDATNEKDLEVPSRFKNLVVLLRLNLSITIYSVETTPSVSSTLCIKSGDSYSKLIHIDGYETLLKPFWWGQWNPFHEFLAFIHNPKRRQSSYEDDEETSASHQVVKPLLSVLQFHEKFPRESVLNMPIDVEQSPLTAASSLNATLTVDPNVVSSPGSPQLKLLAHSSGAIYLLQIHETSRLPAPTESVGTPDLSYSVNCLHHNKTLTMKVRLTEEQKSRVPLRIDAAIYSTDQYLVIVGWPVFIHVLDAGTVHEPSHHLILDYSSMISSSASPFLCLSTASHVNFGGNGDEKFDMSAKTCLTVLFEDMSHSPLELNSAVLLPLLEKADIKLKLSLLHFLLIHIHDINAAKRVTYDESKKRGNIHLKKIYQEFLLGHTFLQSKKQVVQNMESFLLLLPYCSDLDSSAYANQSKSLTMDLTNNCYDVSTFLLSPSQRVFPHNISDVWVCLWQLNRQFKRSKRFSHKNVAEKLGLSLQCYKPEALSRASTPGPMSPSSPMICSSLGDVTGLFGRRSTDLQLPFVEHELCTANKQDYIFSINLRELSMHLLKERKEYPLQGHTVAGKYVWGLVESARLLCHLACLSVPIQPTKSRDKGFKLIDSLDWTVRQKIFMLFEQYSLALVTLACPLPQGFTPFFAYLGYKVFQYDQFLWHVKAGTFELQIDLVKTIMADLRDSEEGNVAKKLHLLSLLPKSRANRVLNTWSHPASISIRARQHSSDLLSGIVSQSSRKSTFSTKLHKKGGGSRPNGEQPSLSINTGKVKTTPLDTFFQLIAAKANYSDIDLGLLTEATVISMDLV